MTKIKRCLISAILMLSLACTIENSWMITGQPEITGKTNIPHNESTALKSAESKTITIKGSLFISSASIPNPGTLIRLDITGVGNISHMGKTHLLMTKEVTTDPRSVPQTWNAKAEITLVTAKNDTLYCSYHNCLVNTSHSPDFKFQTNCSITGGTGRFKSATGTLSYEEVFHWEKAIGKLTLYGEIMLDQ